MPPTAVEAWRGAALEVLDPLLVTVGQAGQAGGAGRPERAARRGPAAQGPPDCRRRCSCPKPTCSRRGSACCEARSTRRTARAASRSAARPAAPTTRWRAKRPRRLCCPFGSASRRRSTPAKKATRAAWSSASVPASANGRTSRSRSRSFDALTVAWSRGVYDASPDGAVLRWIPVVGGSVRRLRRQRARADGQGLVVPHRSDAPSGASGLPVPAGAGRHAQPTRSERVTR